MLVRHKSFTEQSYTLVSNEKGQQGWNKAEDEAGVDPGHAAGEVGYPVEGVFVVVLPPLDVGPDLVQALVHGLGGAS